MPASNLKIMNRYTDVLKICSESEKLQRKWIESPKDKDIFLIKVGEGVFKKRLGKKSLLHPYKASMIDEFYAYE